MNRIDAVLRRVADDLNRRRLPWALVGGFGVSARAEPRFTRDVDVVIAVDDDGDADAEGVVQWMMSLGYRLIASVNGVRRTGLISAPSGRPRALRTSRSLAMPWS